MDILRGCYRENRRNDDSRRICKKLQDIDRNSESLTENWWWGEIAGILLQKFKIENSRRTWNFVLESDLKIEISPQS